MAMLRNAAIVTSSTLSVGLISLLLKIVAGAPAGSIRALGKALHFSTILLQSTIN